MTKTAIVTGAGNAASIGAATAKMLVDRGWAVALFDVNADGVESVRQTLGAQPGQSVAAAVDVTDEESVQRALRVVDESLPPIGGLANLAGIASSTSLLDCSVSEFRRVLDVNLTGTFIMIREVSRRMVAHGSGRIVNFSSITAADGGGTFSKSAYAASKAGVEGLTRGAARELGPAGITVNAIAPGPIDTSIMGGRLSDAKKAELSESIPVGRVGQPADIASLVCYLLSAEAGFINGSTVRADGGKHMH